MDKKLLDIQKELNKLGRRPNLVKNANRDITLDAEFDQLEESYDQMKELVEKANKETQDQIRDIFNQEIEGIEKCGDLLLTWEGFDDLKGHWDGLEPLEQKKMLEMLVSSGMVGESEE